ncbi:MAG: carboxypeptidase M32 [Planctomycetota bacterium]
MGAYKELRAKLREAAVLGSVGGLLGWDQETYMPPGAVGGRADQAALLAKLTHERRTAPELGDLIDAAMEDADASDEADLANLALIRRDFERSRRLPTELVSELASVTAHAQHAWKDARENNDFVSFAPTLEKVISLSRKKAECYGFADGGELYDALLEDYEPGATAAQIEAVFTPLGERLSSLVARLMSDGTAPDDSPTRVVIPEANQHQFGLFILEKLGFDLERGRLDTTTHPFCEGFAPGDTRLTTRYRESRFTDALYGTMHEMGHGLYEQGLDKASRFGEPLGESVSLGIHESQSRMWENLVGRSEAFWRWAMPHANEMLGDLGGADVDAMYSAVNKTDRSFIRVEADEATYNLHVMLRFEIERALFGGDLSVGDLPGAWDERFEQLMGVEVPDVSRGCIQDVHWSAGLFGYFPTYCLGNLYAAQLWEAMTRDLGDLADPILKGEFGVLLGWLREKVHAPGRQFSADELCHRATGEPLSPEPLMRHLESRFLPVYGL